MKIRGEMLITKTTLALPHAGSPMGLWEQVGTTWYNLKTEVVPMEGADRPQFMNAWYGWYNLLQCLAHTRERSGVSFLFSNERGSSAKVVLSVPEHWKSLGWRIFRWYNLHSEVVPGRTIPSVHQPSTLNYQPLLWL